jgi:hypothetical protein
LIVVFLEVVPVLLTVFFTLDTELLDRTEAELSVAAPRFVVRGLVVTDDPVLEDTPFEEELFAALGVVAFRVNF